MEDVYDNGEYSEEDLNGTRISYANGMKVILNLKSWLIYLYFFFIY